MPAKIKCPSCGTEFEPNDIIRDEIEKELRGKMQDWQKKKESELEESLKINCVTKTATLHKTE